MNIMQSEAANAISAELANRARETADRIRVRHNQRITAIIETGLDLLALKEQFGDDQFKTWLQANGSITEGIARKYMRVAVDFGDKIEVVSDLPTAILFKLARRSTPVSVRQIVLAYLDTGWPLTPDEITRLIFQGEQAERTVIWNERQSRITPRQRAVRAQQTVEEEIRQQRWQHMR
jgi:hypothetical protein